MSAMRKEYFRDLLKDCQEICAEMGIDTKDQNAVIAALVQSDSVNGIRKALLTPNYIVAQSGARNAPGTNQY